MIGTKFQKPVKDWTDYSKCAEWCNANGIAHIEDMGGYYECVKNEEPTQEELNAKEIAELERYLSSTDWYVSRYTETGKAIPDEVTLHRKYARERISELRLASLN